ncbi:MULTISPECIES: ABC transporter permease [Dethiosulfovibrio]|uniref:ABC transporter permease n=2 Tax=Dethiosulfovibrio TaxID=47054 RepID=A0ABS9ENW8_9BACT|nr:MULTISPECIES: ABC transporter permease [Dethiosulfovibrio]MCF4114665.1 ABC transporter permease [Dethiosulfovibrio russensis]MCF4142888.1 ABC transporter permease [Dethiosulfovibrio marinus]MCF4144783.1 ABC transporter permease [Dethiosulfovibrio acidaminovorans]MEA3283808.1 ABC transporter permease [Synergistota bacterium]
MITVIDIVLGVVSMGIPLSVPLILAGLGEMFDQRAGIFNLGVEGIMMMGAFVGFFTVLKGGSPWYGFLAAMVVGAVMGAVMGLVSIVFKAQQGISGIGLYMLGWGLSGTLFRIYVGWITTIEGLTPINFGPLGEIPIVGSVLFGHDPMVYITFALIGVSGYVLYRTSWGLKVRAVGTSPRAADTLGIDVNRIRFQCVIVGGVMAGLAGAYLSICSAQIFADNITAGRGFIAVALVYFGRWTPWGVAGGALLFSMAHALQRSIQVYGFSFPYELAVVFPYLLVICCLAFSFKSKDSGPAALGKPYDREFRG